VVERYCWACAKPPGTPRNQSHRQEDGAEHQVEDVIPGVQEDGTKIQSLAQHRVSHRKTENRQRNVKGAGCKAETLRGIFTEKADTQSKRTPRQVQQVVIFVDMRATHDDQDAHQYEESAKEPAHHPGSIRSTLRTAKIVHRG